MEIAQLLSETAELSALEPEARILAAALDCIAEEGLEGATVRTIAARAALNPAAVNYYYRSKDRLVEEALRGAWAHVAADVERILEEAGDPRELLEAATAYFVEGAYRYPRIIRAIFVEHSALKLEVADFFGGIVSRLVERGGSAADPGLAAALLLSFAALLSFGPEAAGRLCGLDLSEAGARAGLARTLSARLFELPRP